MGVSRALITKMAADDKSPLLNGTEEDEFDIPRQKIKSLYQSSNVAGYSDGDDETINISGSTSASNLAEYDHIVAIFVVAFDTRSGKY